MPAVFLLILTVLLNACSPQTKPVTTAEDGSAAVQETQSAVLTPGTYTATVNAHGGPMTVETVLDGESIISVTITDMYETSVVQKYITEVADRIVENQSLAVDVVSGATVGGRALLGAVGDCIVQAGGDPSVWEIPVDLTENREKEYTADVIVVGAGGAGLAAAVSANENGASVIVLEKLGMVGGSTVFSGGGYNAPDAEMQSLTEMTDGNRDTLEELLNKEPQDEFEAEWQDSVREQYEEHVAAGNTWLFDSPEYFMLQTYNGGDYRGNPELIQTLCANALDGYYWLASLGATFQENISMGTGALWSRTHKPSSDYPKGSDVVYPFEDYLNNHEGAQIHLDTKANELIIEDGRVTGVQATYEGETVVYHAEHGVVLATGGFGANVDMREKYNTVWPTLDSSIGYSGQTVSAMGEGLEMAEAVGAQLIDMELIQLHPNGTMGTGKMGTPSTSGYNMIFVNSEGDRFVAEDSRRDDLVNAIYEQEGGWYWIVCDSTKYPEDDAEINSTVELGLTLKADTLEELAELMEVEPERLMASVEQYNGTVDGGEDPFGLSNYDQKLGNGPFYAAKRTPTVHHTMGGVKIDTEAHVISTSGDIIPGLYAAGEVTGGVHGANRLGGNAITDLVVFGRIAGANAASGK